jgi:hypothetical protein
VKPLCDNIFDVQRSELYEVLQQLRSAFWNDEIPIPQPELEPPLETTLLELPIEPSPNHLKRVRSEPDQDSMYQEEFESFSPKKRLRADTPSCKYYKKLFMSMMGRSNTLI